MKYIKMMGVAMVAALALMAVAGAATASANATVCSTNTAPCGGTLYGNGTKISAQLATGTTAVLTNSITNVTCKKSTVAGSLTNSSGAGTLNTLTFTECTTTNGTACTVKAVNLAYSATATATGGGNGTLTIAQGAGGGAPGASVECGFLINCTFTNSDLILDVTGGNPAIIHAKEEPLARSGGLCPSTATWDATYEITAPKPLFLTV